MRGTAQIELSRDPSRSCGPVRAVTGAGDLAFRSAGDEPSSAPVAGGRVSQAGTFPQPSSGTVTGRVPPPNVGIQQLCLPGPPATMM